MVCYSLQNRWTKRGMKFHHPIQHELNHGFHSTTFPISPNIMIRCKESCPGYGDDLNEWLLPQSYDPLCKIWPILYVYLKNHHGKLITDVTWAIWKLYGEKIILWDPYSAFGHKFFRKLVCMKPGSRHPTVRAGEPAGSELISLQLQMETITEILLALGIQINRLSLASTEQSTCKKYPNNGMIRMEVLLCYIGNTICNVETISTLPHMSFWVNVNVPAGERIWWSPFKPHSTNGAASLMS